jgi:transcriptional antiterminator NusG
MPRKKKQPEEVVEPEAPVEAPEEAAVEAPEEAVAETGPATHTAEGKKLFWYAVYVYSGHEKKVLGNLRRRIELSEIARLFGDVVVPSEDVLVQRSGRSSKSTRPYFPGYVIFQMVGRDHELEKADDRDFIDVTNLVISTPGVRGFVGGRRDPAPLDSDEVARILHTEESKTERIKDVPFSSGDQVRITDGPFANFDGIVDEVMMDRHKVRVVVTVFGRATQVEIDIGQLLKT